VSSDPPTLTSADSAHNSGGAPQTRLSRSAILIGFVSLFSDISTEMVYPILPMFITQVLHAPASALGLIEGIAVGTASIVTGISGWISDLVGRRKPVAFVGYALTAVTKPVIAAAGAWPIVLGARFADRFGKGIRTAPKDALLAETVAADHRGRAYGFERMMDYSGAVIGPLIALLLVGTLTPRAIFLLSAAPATLAAILILGLRERPRDVARGPETLRLSLAGTTREYRRLLLIVGVFGLGNSANAFLILRANHLGLGVQATIVAYALYNAVAAGFSMPAGVAGDRLGRRNLLVLGYAIYAVTYLGFGLADAGWMVWPLFTCYGLFPALSDGVAKAMAIDTAGRAGRGTAIGVYSTVVGVTQIAASYAGGLVWDLISPSATFFVGAALSALAALLLVLLLPAPRAAYMVLGSAPRPDLD
jgi:MFS family permease